MLLGFSLFFTQPMLSMATPSSHVIESVMSIHTLPKSNDPGMRGLKQAIFWSPSPNFRERKKESVIDTLQVFPTYANLQDTLKEYSDSNFYVGAHFTIDKDGTLIQHGNVTSRGYHSGVTFDQQGRTKMNDNSIGIGLVHGKDGKEPYPKAQIETLVKLVKYLKNQIPSLTQISRHAPIETDVLLDSYSTFPWSNLSHLGLNLTTLRNQMVRDPLTQDPQMRDFKEYYVYRVDSPNHDPRPEGMIPDTIVLHHTCCSFDTTLFIFQDPNYLITSHYTIDKDGTTAQHADLSRRARHAGKPASATLDKFGRNDVNNFSIGIELVNRGTGSDPYPKEQIEALKSLLRYLLKVYPNTKQITTHEYVARPVGRKDDPLGFPWETLAEFKDLLVYHPDDVIFARKKAAANKN